MNPIGPPKSYIAYVKPQFSRLSLLSEMSGIMDKFRQLCQVRGK